MHTPYQADKSTGFSDLKAVKRRVPKSTPSIYRWIKAGTFPKPVQIGPNSVAWRNSDLDEWEADPEHWRQDNALHLIGISLRNAGAADFADRITSNPAELAALAKEIKQGGHYDAGCALEQLATEICSRDPIQLELPLTSKESA